MTSKNLLASTCVTILYRLDANAAQIARHFDAWAGDDPWPGGTLSPGGFAPVITAGREFIAGARRERGRMRMIPRIWGVPPPPNVPYDGRNAVLSVRNPDSPFWVGNLRNSEFRCLVPASAFMEWGKGVDREGKRIRHWFSASDQPLFAFAGVWKDSEIPTFALLTCEPNATLRAAGRDSMPAILPADRRAWQTWLYAGWKDAREVIAPYPSSLMRDSSGPG